MAALTADFEKGTNGATIATGDAGSNDAWNSVTGSPIYDTTHASAGSQAAKYPTGAVNVTQWNTSSLTGTFYGRFYLYLTTGAASLTQFAEGLQSGSSAFDVYMFSSSQNKLGIRDGGGNSVAASNNLTYGQWYRVEYMVVVGNGTGQLELKYFVGHSTTAVETKTSAATLSTKTSINQFKFGAGSASYGTDLWLDQIVANATGYPGPYPTNTVAPAVTGLTPVGSTLTCDGGTWGGTFTLTYQWVRDGSNIGSATSSTYVTQAADVGHAVGCTVTATGQQATNESVAQTSGNTVTVTSSSSSSGGPDPSKTASAVVLLGL